MIEDNPDILLELNTLAMKSRITRLEAGRYCSGQKDVC